MEYNLYTILSHYPHYSIIKAFNVLLLSLLIFFFFALKIPSIKTYYGECSSDSNVLLYLPLAQSKMINKDSKIYLNERLISFKELTFKEKIVENKVLIQPIIIPDNDEDYHENEIIEVKIIVGKRTLLQILDDSLKGGEDK